MKPLRLLISFTKVNLGLAIYRGRGGWVGGGIVLDIYSQTKYYHDNNMTTKKCPKSDAHQCSLEIGSITSIKLHGLGHTSAWLHILIKGVPKA